MALKTIQMPQRPRLLQPLFHIKVKTPHCTTVIPRAEHPNADEAWERAWRIAGTSHAFISVQVVQ